MAGSGETTLAPGAEGIADAVSAVAHKGPSEQQRAPSLARNVDSPSPSRFWPTVPQAVVVPIAVLLLWQLVGWLEVIPAGILPPPTRVVEGWWTWAFGKAGLGLNSYSGTWLGNLVFSTQRVFQGYGLAIVIAVPLGVMIGWNRLVARLIDPTIQGLRPIPITAWLPFSIAIFGIRDLGAIFLIALGAFYPIVVNSAHGARDVNRNLVRAALMMGATPRQLLFRVVFPSALPAIFTGLRLGLGVSWTAVIVSEMVAVKSGLGYVLWDAYYVGRMDIVMADMVSIGLMGFLTDRILLMIESRALQWKLRAGN
jgi:NitT/TauT family transport system permease protein